LAIATRDGGYLLAGYLWDQSAWVVKTDWQGVMQWNRTYGAKGSSITGIVETRSGGYLLESISNLKDAGLIMIDKAGIELWNLTCPGVTLPIGYEANFNSLIDTKNGYYLMVGSKNQSVWLAKLTYQNAMSSTLQFLPIVVVAVSAVMVSAFLAVPKGRKRNVNSEEKEAFHPLTI
jgi:hypothetical protein